MGAYPFLDASYSRVIDDTRRLRGDVHRDNILSGIIYVVLGALKALDGHN